MEMRTGFAEGRLGKFMIIVLAGRRVDGPDAAQARFPNTTANIEAVRKKIRELLLAQIAHVLVSSAACGSDLLAVEEAGRLGIRRRIFLALDPASTYATEHMAKFTLANILQTQ
jgi:hypothetical protein